MWTLLLSLLQTAPDLVVLHATLPSAPGKNAVVITDGKITDVTTSDVAAKLGAAKVVDADGRVVLPGLIDSHIHFVSGGFAEERLKLHGAKDLAEVQARIKAYADDNKDLRVLMGRGWSYDMFKGMPTRQMIDAVVPDRPVMLSAYDGHTAWANTKALELAGVTKATPDPKDGTIAREADGTPAGAMIEDAMDLLYAKAPEPTLAERKAALLVAQTMALRAGLTAINDFVGTMENYEAYAAVEKEGKLILKVFFSPPIETPLSEALALKARIEKESKRVRFGTLKGFVDGVIESSTATMLAPYAFGEKKNGVAHLQPADLDRLILPADKAGLSVSLHAIGDGAVRLALDAYERAAKQNGTHDRRHRVEHIEVLHPDDARRFKQLGVVASMQPFHAEPTDAPGKGVWERKVGKARMPFIFPWRMIHEAGGTLAFGSDWTVVTLDPLMGLAVAMTRKNGHNLPADGWSPTQKIPLALAVSAYTEGAAWALHAEKEIGGLRAGLAADLLILEEKVAPDEPLSFYWGTVEATLADGKLVSGKLP